MQFDPRTVARDIPGILDELFPQLTPSIVRHLNDSARIVEVRPLSSDLLRLSTLQRAMLFELGYVVGERLIAGDGSIDWQYCLSETLRRQRRYFDAELPDRLSTEDQKLAEAVGNNLANMIVNLRCESQRSIVIQPRIPGLEWIASGYGDFALGSTLVEVKCAAKRFSAADYRQVAIYWLLSYSASIEGRGTEWDDFVLLNPRSGQMVQMTFNAFVSIVSSGRTKVDVLQLFQALIDPRLAR